MIDHIPPTKERILISAGDIFGKKGFKDTTIRMIAKAAQVNIAAINYHFRDKEGLYGAVLDEVFHSGFTRFPAHVGGDANEDPDLRLRTCIRAMFYRFQSTEGWGGMSGHGRLIARELLDPSPAFESVLDRYIKPHKDLLYAIVVAIMKIDPGPEKVMQCVISVIGQCIYYALGGVVLRKISADNAPTDDNLDRLADSVWLFSLGGIARMKEEITTSCGASSGPLPMSPFLSRKEEI